MLCLAFVLPAALRFSQFASTSPGAETGSR